MNFRMKKVLLISKTPCYPLFSGGAIAQYFFIDGLKNDIDFVFCTEIHNDKELENLELLQQKQPRLKIYQFDVRKPLKKTSIKNYLIGLLVKLYRISTGKNRKITGYNSDDFQDSYFAQVDHKFNPEFVKLINAIIKKENIEQVQFDFYDTIDLCWAIPANIQKIFIHHEVRFKRLELAFDTSKTYAEYKQFLIEKTEAFEKLCLQQMDRVVVFNENDAELLKKDCTFIDVSPFGVPDELIFKNKENNHYEHLLFVGGETHSPNLLGIVWFLDEIYLPHVEKIKYPIQIIGDWSESVKERYKNYSKIHFFGIVESLEQYYENSILINPILTGSGLRTKILQAFINKVPIISTRFGAEGCFEKDTDTHIALFDNADEFMDILNKCNFTSMAVSGFEYYNKKFNKQTLLSQRLKILSQKI